MILVKNEYFILENHSDSISLNVFKKGYSLADFNRVLAEFPRISITSFPNLKKGIEEAAGEAITIGRYLPLISCTISQDKMTASIKLLSSDGELDSLKKELPGMILETLQEAGVTEGLLMEVIDGEIPPLKSVAAAKGIEPLHGEDAAIRYFELSERKPVIEETGKANFYHMNFVDEVEKGDWLGEKLPPTAGRDGRNVLGEPLKARKGKDKRLIYDPKSVLLVEEGGKSLLKAAAKGIVSKKEGRISVADHLVIDGDVGIATGNIEFDGSVTVEGTVCEGFSVVAGFDVAVKSEFGVRQVGRIESLNGDIYLKGGVFGKGIIKAAKNIYVKHANECSLEAGGDIHIGFYAKSSDLTARNVITEKTNGKIMGGQITAQGKVFANEIGSKIEHKTIIQVEGFERGELEEQYNELLKEYKKAIGVFEEIHRQTEIYETFANQLNSSQKGQMDSLKMAYDLQMKEISALEARRKSMLQMLEIKGDGEISIFEKAYPETYIEIRNMKKKVNSITKGTFYAAGRELKYE
ncbi:FapA family protein [Metabacillus sp. GX 13764]|uniref:DUF342 domain-containing protein n=1 Tax=Metabacillus kandeliae TaxID=2900151 RepID=UPI001E62214F|nr:FapA family protein [Metabacillus kandeliae]MCD7034242.1 FapA family protein [Metabacillus kandeliae]